MPLDPLRVQLAKALDWEDAHVSFDRAVADVPKDMRDVVHIRRTQFDILNFSRNPDYAEPVSMTAYWPESPASHPATSWDDAIEAVRRDRQTLKALARDSRLDLFSRIPHGTGQTYLRELILIVDHTAYHVGQIVAVRRALGIWTT